MQKLFLIIGLIQLSISVQGQQLESQAFAVAEKYTLYSKILNEDREIYIHVPKGFWGLDEKLEHYPVIFVLDGESQFLHTVSTIDFLSASPLGNDLMPRSIIVGIPNTDRSRDLTPIKGMIGSDSTSLEITGGGKAFLAFITNELTPFIENHFPTSTHRTIIGHSLGGLIVFEALLNQRAHFTNYLAIDPGLGFDNESYFNRIVDTLRSCDLSEENLFIAKANTLPTFLDEGSIEEDNSEVVKITKSNKKMLALANAEYWRINFLCQEFPKENHFSIPHPATYHGMQFFYTFYPFKEMINYYHPSFKMRSDLVDKLKEHFQVVSQKMGYEMKPLQSYINSWAYGLSHYDRADLSLDLFDYNIELYPEKSSVYKTKGYFIMNNNIEEAIALFEKSLSLEEDENLRKSIKELKDTKN